MKTLILEMVSGLNKNQIAKKMNVSPQYIGDILNQKKVISLKTLYKFAKVFNYKVNITIEKND